MNQFLMVGNWKMNTSLPEAIILAHAIKLELENTVISETQVVICPPFPWILPVSEIFKTTNVKLGAQNISFETVGSYTGEIAGFMLSEICDYVIIGHSERRQVMAESDEDIGRKLAAATNAGISPILCLGETLLERQRNETEAVIKKQISIALTNLKNPSKLILAYEPVWAIGTGLPASPCQVVKVIDNIIRPEITRICGRSVGPDIPILYGGSINDSNAIEFLKENSIHGTLLGSASLNAKQFSNIARLTSEAKIST